MTNPAEGSQQVAEAKPVAEAEARPEHPKGPPPATFAIQIEYKGEERSTKLLLDQEMIKQLAMEAEFRGMRIGELVTALILAIAERDLFGQVLTNAPEQRVGIGANSHS